MLSVVIGRMVLAAAVVTAAVVGLPTATGSSGADAPPLPQAELLTLARQSTAKLVAVGCTLGLREGSAVALASDRLLTNRHVAGAVRQIDVVPDTGAMQSGTSSTDDSLSDVALVHVGGLGFHPVSLATRDSRVGTSVVVAGYPQGANGLVVTSAKIVDYVSGTSRGQPTPVMRLAIRAHPGMSGGPLLDQSGHLAGLLFGSESPSDYGLAIPASALRDLLRHPTAFTPAGCQR
jgi:S1-C subfamily serine protease